jgi:TorA maturation chaperone TorD
MDIQNMSHNILKGYNMLLYFAGSMIMYEPNEECVVDFWQQGIITKLPVSSTNPKFALAASQLRDSCQDRAQCLKNLRDDHNRLFNSAGLSLAPAFESSYLPERESGHKSLSVSEFYNSYGWTSKYKGIIRDDHLGIELLFLTILIDKYLIMDDQVCLIEIRNEIRRFIDQHILSWINGWYQKMQEHAKTMGYKGIATLIYACVEDIYSLCDNNPYVIRDSEVLKN